MRRCNYWYIVINIFSVIFYCWFAYSSFYNLFIFEKSIHYPLIDIFHNIPESDSFSFTMNLPTICNLIILIMCLMGLVSAIVVFRICLFRLNSTIKKIWIVQIIAIILIVVSEAIIVYDFYSSAFTGVG